MWCSNAFKLTIQRRVFVCLHTCSCPGRLHQDLAWGRSWRSHDLLGSEPRDAGSPGSQSHLSKTHTHAHDREIGLKRKPKTGWQLIEFWETKGEGRTARGIVRIRGGIGDVKPKSIQMEWSWRRWKNRQHIAGQKPTHLIRNDAHTHRKTHTQADNVGRLDRQTSI